MFTLMKRKSQGRLRHQILGPEEVEAYKDIFKVFDQGGKGYLTVDDFSRVGALLNANDEATDTWSKFDANGDGKVTIDELLSAVMSLGQKNNTEPEMMHTFRLLDKNNDGHLDKAELKELMTSVGKQLSQKDVDELMKRFDSDLDGKLQYAEFVKMLN